MLCVGVLSAITVISASFKAAVQGSIVGAYANQPYVVQVLDGSAEPTLARSGSFQPIWQKTGTAGRGDREVPVELRYTPPGNRVPAVVKTGRAPQVAGEMLISERAAQLLRVDVGDEVTAYRPTPTVLKVTGISRDAAQRDTAALTFLATPEQDSPATIWVGTADPFENAQLRAGIEKRQLSARTIRLVASEEAAGAATVVLRPIRYAVQSLAVLSVVLLASLMLLLTRALRRDLDGLRAVGMAGRSINLLTARAAVVCSLGGAAIGVALSVGGLWLGRDFVSRQLNQDWGGVSLQLRATLQLALLVPAAAILLTALVAVISRYGRRFSALPHRLAAIAALGATASSILVIVVGGPFQAAPFYLLTVCLVVTGVAWRLSAVGVGHGTSVVTRTLARSLTPLAMLAAALVFATTWYSAWNLHTSLASEALWRPAQPAGSLLVNGVGAQGRQAIIEAYQQLGGKRFSRYQLADEQTSTLRVTSPSTVTCLSKAATKNILDVPSFCYSPDQRSPLNIIALSSEAATGAFQVDTELISNNQVGLLDIGVPSGTITYAGTTPATPSSELGGYMPGAVLSPASPIAVKHHLRPTGYEFLVLLDMSNLTPDNQAQLRSTIRRSAGAAQVAEDTGFVDETGQRQLSSMAALIGFGVAALFIGGLGVAFVGSHASIRRLLRDLGLTKRRRFYLATRFSAPVLLAVVVGTGLGLLAAWMSGAHDGSGFGWAWMLPGVGGLLAYGSLIANYSRTPNRNEA
ncbi:hypothetical protein GCM10009744_18550 [Kribbella alba]|uniref:FtsX-like permease family protein n=2 Tax=Kribbella alba TaxID=190197 RepID=A0ABN2F636_9ACTN